MDKLVSICIPTYNGEKYILEALSSVNSQNYKNIEIIISDDNSNDNTLKIVNDFIDISKFPIKIVHHKPNGIGANWNNSLKHASGEFIKFLFQDDILKFNCVYEMVQVLIQNSNIGLVASKRDFIYDVNYLSDDLKVWTQKYGDLQKGLNLTSTKGILIIDKQLFKKSNFLHSPLNKIGEPSTYMFRKKILKEVGWFREDLKQILDYEFCYRILKKYNIVILEDSLVKFRLHQNQETNINRGKSINDYNIYSEIVENEYFRYLSLKKQIEILRSNYKFINYFFVQKAKFKR